MQIDKKKLIAIMSIIVVILIVIGVVVFQLIAKNKRANEYYYEFKYDDNLLSQSVWVYNGNDELQTEYYLYYDGKPIAYTRGEKAVVTIMKLDLKDKPVIDLIFEKDKKEGNDKTFKVEHKK